MAITITTTKLAFITLTTGILLGLTGLFIGYMVFGSSDATVLENYKAQVEQLKADLIKKGAGGSDATTLDAYKKQVQQLEAELNTVKDELLKANGKLVENENIVDITEYINTLAERNTIMTELAEKKKTITDLEEQIRALRIQAANSDVGQLQLRITDLESQLKMANEETNESVREFNSANQRIIELEN